MCRCSLTIDLYKALINDTKPHLHVDSRSVESLYVVYDERTNAQTQLSSGAVSGLFRIHVNYYLLFLKSIFISGGGGGENNIYLEEHQWKKNVSSILEKSYTTVKSSINNA